MALTKRSTNPVFYLEVKHYCLWRPVKAYEINCEEIEVNNPSTGEKVKKYGYRFDTVTGRALELAKYDTGQKYGTRYFGFKLHLIDGVDRYVLDMPYHSQILRRFLRIAHNVDWSLPLSITIFKGKGREGKKAGAEETGVWFRQQGDTVSQYYSKEQPHGMPIATFDQDEQKWDFKAQHRWLVERLQNETIEDIQMAAARVAPPLESDVPANIDHFDEEPHHEPDRPFSKDEIDMSDVPF